MVTPPCPLCVLNADCGGRRELPLITVQLFSTKHADRVTGFHDI